MTVPDLASLRAAFGGRLLTDAADMAPFLTDWRGRYTGRALAVADFDGDGLPDLVSLRDAGVRLCTGIDSHVLTDPFDDLRSLETHARLRTKKRVTFQPLTESPAEALWREGSLHGALACGFSDVGGSVLLDREHPSLALVDDADLLDAVVFSGSPALVRGLRID